MLSNFFIHTYIKKISLLQTQTFIIRTFGLGVVVVEEVVLNSTEFLVLRNAFLVVVVVLAVVVEVVVGAGAAVGALVVAVDFLQITLREKSQESAALLK